MGVEQDVKTDVKDLHAQLSQYVADLAKKHATVSYTLIGLLVLVLALMGVGAYFGLRSYEAQLARAEAQEKQYNIDRKELTAQLTTSAAHRADDTKQQSVIVKVVHDRDTSTDKKIAEATAPGKAPMDALQDLSNAYKGTIKVDPAAVTPDGQLAFPVFTVQGFTSTKLDRDRLAANLDDANKSFKLEQDKTASLTSDLAKVNGTLKEANNTIDGYKKAAKKSKWRKALDGSAKVGIFVVGVYAGHAIK